ncbi:MAG: class I SAM-dependent methyltransferase [Verrucomicrobiota bacterium]|nr:class I SAM-dependent methyltransferase [Verrucomicrobiota bacterium]
MPSRGSLETMRTTEKAHECVREMVRPGDHVIDATAGNGHDTLFLARLVGPDGQVTAFDVQEDAISATRTHLLGNGITDDRVVLVHGSHSTLRQHVDCPVSVVMFNLGYLPGSDHGCTTTCEETLIALAESWEILRESGVLSVVCYRGHPGGMKEAAGVVEFAEGLQDQGARVVISGQEDTEAGPFLVIRRKEKRLAAHIGPG